MEINFHIEGFLLLIIGLIGMFCFYSFYAGINSVHKYFQNEMNSASEISATWYKENPLFIDKEIDYEILKVRNPIKIPNQVSEANTRFNKMKKLRDLTGSARTLAIVLGVLCMVSAIYSLTIGQLVISTVPKSSF